jgi:hypothetical protein
MKTLVAIINEPKNSIDFIRYVSNMAGDLKLNLHLLYSENLSTYPLGTTGATGIEIAQVQSNQRMLIEDAKKILESHIKEISSEISKEVFIDYTSELGDTATIVSKMLSESKVHMAAFEGQRNENFWAQSSNVMQIIDKLTCPVWIIPKNALYFPYSRIIYATNYKEEDITSLKNLTTLAEPYTPNITALHITDSIDFEEKVKKAGFLEMVKKRTSNELLSVKVLRENNTYNTSEIINDYALRIKANLIVVLKENKSFFEQIFKTDSTKEIIEISNLPILVYNESE